MLGNAVSEKTPLAKTGTQPIFAPGYMCAFSALVYVVQMLKAHENRREPSLADLRTVRSKLEKEYFR